MENVPPKCGYHGNKQTSLPNEMYFKMLAIKYLGADSSPSWATVDRVNQLN